MNAGWWRRIAAALVAIHLGFGAAGYAQTTTRPQRAFRGLFGGVPTPDPNRTRQELTLTGSLVGGYDDNPAAEGGSGTPQPGSPSLGSTLAAGQVDVHYFRGQLIRSIAVDGSGFITSYGDHAVGLVEGGSVTVSGTTRVRRADALHALQYVGYEPLLTLGSFAALDPAIAPGESPETGTVAGLVERRSINAQTSAGYLWKPGRRTSVTADYGFQTQRYLDSDSEIGDAQSHIASAGYIRTASRNASYLASYSYGYAEVEDANGTRPLTHHTIEGGPQYNRAVSRTRRIQLSAALGAQYVETLSSAAGSSRTTVDYWTPFGSASANVDLARDWGLRGTYRRSTIVIPEVTTESFVSDAVSVGTDALLGSRFDFDISAALSTGTSAVATGSNATYRSGTYAASCRWAFTRGFAAIFNYYYYDYRFTNTPDLPEGFPPVSQRHAFRAGVTIWLPLVGGYIDTRTASNTGRP